MKNARTYDEQITIGGVPDSEDLAQLKELSYRTLVDLREERERFGGWVQSRARDLGFRYVSIPIRREAIRMEDVSKFYDAVYEKGAAPIYAFSRFGKKPLAFLLLLEVVAKGEHLPMIFRKASRFGLHLQGDEVLQEFLVDVYNSGNMGAIVESIRKHRPDLFAGRTEPLTGTKATNIHWHSGEISRADRERAKGHRGFTLWFTGLSAAGKSTLASALEHALFQRGYHTYILDGDNIRHGLNKNLGFSPEDREENIRRIGEVAKLFRDAGIINMTAFISPYTRDRQLARGLGASEDFIEVFVDCSVQVCEARDPKGMYKKAREGVIKEFTGVSAPYEAPENPEVHLRTDEMSVDECVQTILEYLVRSGRLSG